jgi:hypothetical protein
MLPGIGGSVLARPGRRGKVVWDAGKGDVTDLVGGLVARYWMGPLQRWRWCRALITLGTSHRGAPKALNWLVNGVLVLGVELSRPTELLREWPSVDQLLPRYKAVLDTTTADRSWYPHELPIPSLGAPAMAAYELHCEIEGAWRDMPGGPEMVACIGWGDEDQAPVTGSGRDCCLTGPVPSTG